MKKIIQLMTSGCFILYAILGGAQQQTGTPQVNVPILPKARAMSPGPPANVKGETQKNTIGESPVRVTTAQPSTYWEEVTHIGESYHAPVRTAFLYDATAGILYAYRRGDFDCNNQHMTGPVLEALYTSGNQAGREVGSGWYIAELNVGECGAKQDGLYGCRFTANGRHTECGRAAIGQSGEIDLAANP